MTHIGKEIRRVFDSLPEARTVAWFARELHCNRCNVYNIFARRTIDTELLARISRVLNHDFFLDLSAELNLQGDKGVTAYRGISADCK
ncbi:MAG: XRE family transcriptional regulator [Muribaculaceae bacterium]|nr:XRE family transcriptional regulator [Muribaculaceae bacterium]